MRHLATLVCLLSLVIGCSSAPPLPAVKVPTDPAKVAREARLGSLRACNAYRLAVSLGATKPDERADAACLAVSGVCAEPASLGD
jgi:hypothetical protein